MEVDESREISSIDVYYTQQVQTDGKKDNSNNTKNRFWHHSEVGKQNGKWTAQLNLFAVEKPLWVYSNVSYKLKKPITAGYYYGIYSAKQFTLSSLMRVATSEDLKKSGVITARKPNVIIEDFKGTGKRNGLVIIPRSGGMKTHKVYHPAWRAPDNSKLYFEIKAKLPQQNGCGA